MDLDDDCTLGSVFDGILFNWRSATWAKPTREEYDGGFK
jgi:hypothetical protein